LFLWAWQGCWLTWQFDYYPPVRLAQFVLGVLCGAAVRRGLRFQVPFVPAVVLVVGYHAVLYGLHLWSSAAGGAGRALLYSGSQWWSAPVYALLIVAAAQADLRRRPTGVANAVFLRLGHWSYAWYLVHEIVIRLAVGWGGRPASLLAVVAWWLGLLAVTLACAFVLYTVVEHPAERRLRALVGQRGREADATTPAPLVGDGRREAQDLRRPSSP
jgi:peptidoglycan/LPS O-acetylase OafA/YrhL